MPELIALVKNNLPDFVLKNSAKVENQIIVFSMHTPDPVLFDRQMRFLAENGYHTVNTEEFHRYLLHGVPPKCLMLTFDDCRASLWTTVFSILKKYNLKGIAYLSPYFITKESGENAQYHTGQNHAFCLGIDNSSYPFSAWKEISEMHNSGIIDFQGHTYFHELIFTSPKIKYFIEPGYNWGFHNFVYPVVSQKGLNNYNRQLPLGTPIYEMDLRMSGKLRYYDDEDLREHCVGYVRKNGGEYFFKRKKWKKQLLLVAKKYRDLKGDKGYFEKHKDMKSYLLEDFINTRKTIESRLVGKKITSMCFPWEVGSDIAIEAAKEAGYKSCVWGIIPGRKTNRAGDDPYHVCRLSSDFIFRLPGKGRISFAKLIINKVIKRLNIFNKH